MCCDVTRRKMQGKGGETTVTNIQITKILSPIY